MRKGTLGKFLDALRPYGGTGLRSSLRSSRHTGWTQNLLTVPCDRQVPGQDDIADVRLRSGLTDEQQVVKRVVDEIKMPLDVVLVDVDAAGGT